MNRKLTKFVHERFVMIARDLISNPDGLKFKIDKALSKISKDSVKSALGNGVGQLKLLTRLIKSWTLGEYRDVEKETILYAVIAVVYFLTPTDFVPDFLLGLGFVDDLAVLAWAVEKISGDLDKFKSWENLNQ